MQRYFFSISNREPYTDVDGLELEDLERARDEALGFARDVMRMDPDRTDWSDWSVHVTDSSGTRVLTVPFTSLSGATPDL